MSEEFSIKLQICYFKMTSTKNFTFRFWNVYGSTLIEKDKNILQDKLILNDDNAPSHTALLVMQPLVRKQDTTAVVGLLTDLAWVTFMFQKLKIFFKSSHSE